jgi:hypothetical protein
MAGRMPNADEMEQAQFERWARTWTADAARDPKNARASAKRFATFAMYVPFLMFLGLFLIMGVGAFVAMIPWIVTKVFGYLLITLALGVCAIIGAALPGKLQEPPGIPVTKAEVPLLFERVNRAAAAIDVKPPKVIRIDEGDEVDVTWWGQRGFATPAGHLRVGLATISMLEHDEMDSVLTVAIALMLHKEAAHLRTIQHAHAWYRAMEAKLEPRLVPGGNLFDQIQSALLSATLGPAMRAIVPRLAGMERTFWRDREMASDRVAVSGTSRIATSRALVRRQVRASWWRSEIAHKLDAVQRTSQVPEPSIAVSCAMLAGGEISPLAGSVMFARCLTEPDDPLAMNTPIGKRVAAVGMGIDRPGVDQVTFAEAAAWAAAPASGQLWNSMFPGGPTSKALARVASGWAAKHATEWREANTRLAPLDSQGQFYAAEANSRELRADQYLLIAGWARARYGNDMARDWLRYAVHKDPYHAGAALDLGRELVMLGDNAGVSWLEHASNIAPDLADEANAWVAAWYRACGDQSGAESRAERRGKERQTMRTIRWTPFETRAKSRIAPVLPSERERTIVRALCAEHQGIIFASVARHDIRAAPMGRLPLTVTIEFATGTDEKIASDTRDAFAAAIERAWLGSRIDQVEVVWGIRDAPGAKIWNAIRNSPQTHVWDPADEARRDAAAQEMPVAQAQAPAQPAQPAQQVHAQPQLPAAAQPAQEAAGEVADGQDQAADPAQQGAIPGHGYPVPGGASTPAPLPGHGTPVPVPGQQAIPPAA